MDGWPDGMCTTYRGVVGFCNKTVVILAVNLDDWRVLGVETSVDG